MVQMNENKVIKVASAATFILLAAAIYFLNTVKTPGTSRIPAQEIYSQGISLNYYVNYLLPIVIVFAILFIAGLSTFGLYHGSTREALGTRPLYIRLLDWIKSKITEK